MKIFLGDLVHTWNKVSVWTMPLNIGYIAAYAEKYLPSYFEFKLFKDPELMIKAIKEEKPDNYEYFESTPVQQAPYVPPSYNKSEKCLI